MQDDNSNARAPAMKLVVPEPLKAQLVDDWESVTKELSVRLTHRTTSCSHLRLSGG